MAARSRGKGEKTKAVRGEFAGTGGEPDGANEPGEQASFSVCKSFAPQEGRGTLYLVATPIGNLEDMTFRAVRTLKEADLIAAEDTRQTRKLLTHFEIATRLVSYHEHNKEASGPELVRLLLEGQSVALVSDAGLPAISDPGSELAAQAIAAGIAVVPVPGANAALSALIVSGLPTERFRFVGFLPREKKRLREELAGLAHAAETLLFYEAPHRIAATLAAMAEAWGGDRRVALVRELTKRHEEAGRGTLTQAIAHVAAHPPLGEYCIVVQGGASVASDDAAEAWWAELPLEEHVAAYERQGESRKDAMKRAANDLGVPKREVYNRLL